jgi:hypothetical protein
MELGASCERSRRRSDERAHVIVPTCFLFPEELMVARHNDGFDHIREMLELMPEFKLIEYGRKVKKRYLESRSQNKLWVELQCCREEWRARHPKQKRVN